MCASPMCGRAAYRVRAQTLAQRFRSYALPGCCVEIGQGTVPSTQVSGLSLAGRGTP